MLVGVWKKVILFEVLGLASSINITTSSLYLSTSRVLIGSSFVVPGTLIQWIILVHMPVDQT